VTAGRIRRGRALFGRIWCVGHLALWPWFLAACQPGGAVPINGKVIAGNISFIGAVDPNDERLKGPGLSQATITGSALIENQGGVDLGETTSDQKGSFRLNVREQRAFSRPAEFNVSKDGYITATAKMPLPSTDRRLLVILKPESGGGAARPK
jgi:hypothetical protein